MRQRIPGSTSCRLASTLLRLVALGTVLILAREEIVAALLGMLVELRGLQPRFLGRAEPIEDAILREKPCAVVIDCDHSDCTDELLEIIKNAGSQPVLFSAFQMRRTSVSSERHGIGRSLCGRMPDFRRVSRPAIACAGGCFPDAERPLRGSYVDRGLLRVSIVGAEVSGHDAV